MYHARMGLTLVVLALLSACNRHSGDFWKEAEPNDVVRVAVVSAPPGTSGKGGGTAVAYATDAVLEKTIETYVEFFRARGVPAVFRESQWVYFDDPKSGMCMTIERWGQGVGFNVLSGRIDEADEAKMMAASGAYWILVPDDCSYKG
jgi:hypothetical protein